MTVTMIMTGTSLDGFAALSYAAEDQDAPAVTQEQDASVIDAEEPAEEEVIGEEPVEVIDGDTEAEAEVEIDADIDEEADADLVYQTLKANKVKLEGLMPEDAKATATDASDTKAVRKLEGQDGTMLAAYDITIKADGAEYQPDSVNPILVQISDKAITEDSYLTIWHIKDNGKKEQIEDFEISKGTVTFEATGFSVYAIVKGPDPLEPSPVETVQTLEKLSSEAGKAKPTGFYMSIIKGGTTYYVAQGLTQKGSNGYVVNRTTDKNNAALWYFEPTGSANDYYLYTLVGDSKKYLKVKNLYFDNYTDDNRDATAFSASLFGGTEGTFLLCQSDAPSVAINYSGSNNAFKLWNTNVTTNTDCEFTLTYPDSVADDPFSLGGKSYGILNYRGGTTAVAMMSDTQSNNSGRRMGKDVQVREDPIKKDAALLVIAQENKTPFDITIWTFTNVSGDIYTLSTDVEGSTKYLKLQNSSATLSDTADSYCQFKIVPCDGDDKGKIRIVNCDGYELNLNEGKAKNGFYGRTNYTGPDNRMTLAEPSEVYGDNDFVEYTAKKVGISEKDENNENIGHYVITNKTKVIIYTRVWDDTAKKYNFYAIDHDGDLIYCYETGDHIRWTGARVNTMLWEFTEYYYEGTNEPNYYYELENTYSGKYIAPQITGGVQTLSNGKIGINLEGRRDNEYSSTILAWDDDQYDYAGLKVTDNLKLTAVNMADADTFYFAIMDESSGTLTPINTVDHEEAADLKMKMYNFNNGVKPSSGNNTSPISMDQWNVIQDQSYTVDKTYSEANNGEGLVYSYIQDGQDYPVATKSGQSLGNLFTGGQQVNHLFLKDTYEESGYFVYDSSQNFAHLNKTKGEFEVYKELGTIDAERKKETLDHGQFMPYNNLDITTAAENHPVNITDITANPLPEENPRKGETLYRYGNQGVLESPDYYFGMEIEGTMVQTPSGKDKWGHDIIFEFTGDDDFWLYVDGLMVLDLGGIHKALSGSVNYSTGEVIVNGKATTLREMFRKSYAEKIGKAPDSQEVETYLNKTFRMKNGNYVFRDYSAHNIKIFFMERGAGASNLRMRFNLSSVTPGHVLLSKELSGTEQDKYAGVEYPFQIWIDTEGEGNFSPAGSEDLTVKYQNTDTDVKYNSNATINGTDYQYIYYLKPDEVADIDFPDETENYYIKECGVDNNIYDIVEVNGGTDADPDNVLIETVNPAGSDFIDYATTALSVNERAKVTFTNHAKAESLKVINVKKKLVDNQGNHITGDNTGFRLRMYMGPTTDESDHLDNLSYYRLSPYYVKDENGNYCWYNNGFQSLNKTDFDSLSAVEKRKARFTTSPSGAIDKIPDGYSFEIRDILVGTSYKVEERNSDLPKGYTFKTFTTGSEFDPNQDDITKTTPNATNKINVEVVNEKGLGLTANKIWSDEDCTEYHEDIYLAVFDGDQLLHVNRTDLGINNDYVKRIRTKTNDDHPTPDKSVYFFIPQIGEKTFADYSVKEVKLTGDNITVDRNGFVTGFNNYSVTTNPTEIEAKPDGESEQGFNYYVTCEKGTVPDGKNTRIDTVINTRVGGIRIVKEDMDGNKLPGATFTLKKGEENIGEDTYTSDSIGTVTTMYNYETDVDYTLTETISPAGYTGIPSAVTIKIDNSTGIVSAEGSGLSNYIEVNQNGSGNIPTITIKNRKSEFIVKKVDQSGNPLKDAMFSLTRQIEDSQTHEPRKDYYPIPEYEKLPDENGTTSNGIVMDENKTKELLPNTYYLTETQTPGGYIGLSEDLIFTISQLGVVSVETSAYSSFLSSSGAGTANDPLVYQLNVQNTQTGIVAPTGYTSYMWPLIWMMLLGMFLYTAMAYMRRRRGIEAFAMEAAGVDGYDELESYEDVDGYEDSNADIDFAADDAVVNEVSEVQSEPSEGAYEAFDWTRIII